MFPVGSNPRKQFWFEMRKWNMKGKKPLEVYYGVSAIQIFSTSEVSYPNCKGTYEGCIRQLFSVIDGMLYQEITNFLCCWSEYYCFLNIIVGVISYYDDIYLSKLVTKVHVIPKVTGICFSR